MANETLKTASVLAFERKLDPSNGLFSSGEWHHRSDSDSDQWSAIKVFSKSVRGTISNRLKSKDQDPAKLDAKIQHPNLQTVDVATLPADADSLRVQFTLRVLGGAGTPSACNRQDYQAKLRETVDRYKNANGFSELARRYATNLANGRFLWRNRVGAEAIEVAVDQWRDGESQQLWKFDSLQLNLRNFEATSAELNSLAKVIEAGLLGESFTLLKIRAYVRMGAGQEVFPSQELILDSNSDKSKTLYTVDQTAAMHSQKLGNALRTIDTWYPDEDGLGPIAVEPFGSVTSRGKAYRTPGEKQDFYSLLDNWVLRDDTPAIDQQHFVIANLIRGGVFGESEN